MKLKLKNKQNFWNFKMFKSFKVKNNKMYKGIKVNFIEKLRNNIENELYTRYDYDQETNRRMSFSILLKIWGIDILMIISLLLIFGTNSYTFIIILFFICFINKEMINKFLDYEEEKILFQLPEFIDELKSSYYETKMISEALYNTNLNSSYEIAIRGKKMLSILESNNVSVEIEKYNRESKNKFLKILINIMYLTKENGDIKEKDGKSIFIKNLNYLLEEINIEILKQNMFKIKFQGLIIATVFPVFFINFIEMWSINNFEILGDFYNSYLGFIIKNVIVLVTIFMGSLILKIKDSELALKSKIKYKNNKDEKILRNKKVGKILKKINRKIFNNSSKEYANLVNKLEKLYCDITPNEYIKAKLKIIAVTNVFTVLMFLTANKFISVITSKIIILEIVVSIMTSFVASLVLDFNIKFENKMKRMNIKDEINNFRTIILLIIRYPFASVEEILKHIEKYSIFYKNQIRRCINDIENGAEYALIRLKNEVEEKDFKKIVRCLVQCSKNICPTEAFGFLENEREFYKDELKNRNMQSVLEKTNLAQLISIIPYYTLVILYFVMPMIMIGVREIGNLIQQLSII